MGVLIVDAKDGFSLGGDAREWPDGRRGQRIEVSLTPSRSGPAHQQEFGTEPGSHGHQHARASARWVFGDGVAQYM